jgi:hypothetical protein
VEFAGSNPTILMKNWRRDVGEQSDGNWSSRDLLPDRTMNLNNEPRRLSERGMDKLKEPMLSLFAVTMLCAESFPVAAASTWPDIKVDVKASHPVTTKQSLARQVGGFQRLNITLSNHGRQPLAIERITVRIPLAGSLTDNLEMLYGGSCMRQSEPVKLEARHSTILKYDGKDPFTQVCNKLQSK